MKPRIHCHTIAGSCPPRAWSKEQKNGPQSWPIKAKWARFRYPILFYPSRNDRKAILECSISRVDRKVCPAPPVQGQPTLVLAQKSRKLSDHVHSGWNSKINLITTTRIGPGTERQGGNFYGCFFILIRHPNEGIMASSEKSHLKQILSRRLQASVFQRLSGFNTFVTARGRWFMTTDHTRIASVSAED